MKLALIKVTPLSEIQAIVDSHAAVQQQAIANEFLMAIDVKLKDLKKRCTEIPVFVMEEIPAKLQGESLQAVVDHLAGPDTGWQTKVHNHNGTKYLIVGTPGGISAAEPKPRT